MKKRFLSMFLVAALALSACGASALAAEERASLTLACYTAKAEPGDGDGEIEISYDVQASGIADKVGVFSIEVYESDTTPIATVFGNTENKLVRTDTNRHKSIYVYTGTPGTSYYFIVTVFADVAPYTDSRVITTSTVKAPIVP